MKPSFDKDKATETYTRLMKLTQAGAYQERNLDGSSTEDRIGESLERLEVSAAVLGFCFRWHEKTARWTLEPMSEQEKAAFADALHDFAEQEQKAINGRKEDQPGHWMSTDK